MRKSMRAHPQRMLSVVPLNEERKTTEKEAAPERATSFLFSGFLLIN